MDILQGIRLETCQLTAGTGLQVLQLCRRADVHMGAAKPVVHRLADGVGHLT